jgi:hypothetical protein
MAAETTSRSVRVLSAQDAKIRAWRKTKLFNVSAYFQDCIAILEEHPEILDSARPGDALRRALADAKRAGELEVENSAMMTELERLRRRCGPGEAVRQEPAAPGGGEESD